MVHDFPMDMEVSAKPRQAHSDDDGLKLDRLSALLSLATDSNSSISTAAINELCTLDSHSIQLLGTDLLLLTELNISQSSREKIFRQLVRYHQTLPSLSTALALELMGDEHQQDIALELLPLIPRYSIGAVPILVYLAEMFPLSEVERPLRFLECARNISPLTDRFISKFAPELPHRSFTRGGLTTELEICGRLLFTEDHDVFSSRLKDMIGHAPLKEEALVPSPIFLLLEGNLSRMSIVTQLSALRIASLGPTISRDFGKRIASKIREYSPSIVRQSGLSMLMNIAAHEFPLFTDDFESLLLSEHNIARLSASLTLHLVSHTLSSEHQMFLIDLLLRAARGADIERYKNILFCMEGLDAEQVLPHLFKLYLDAPSTEFERAAGITIQRIKDLLPSYRRSSLLARIRNELELDVSPSFKSFIKTILE